MADTSVLLVEDEESISSFVAMYLRKEGFGVEVAPTGAEGLRLAAAGSPDIVILDIMLPDMDGFEICRQLRSSSQVPIIMLTARDTATDKVVGLELGADDYMTKPFDPRELVARVKSILRRVAAAPTEESEGRFRSGELLLDTERREVFVADREVELTAKEFDLLHYLLTNRGMALSRHQILERVWGYQFAGDTRTVDVHINQLRKKVGEAVNIETVRTIGYKLK